MTHEQFTSEDLRERVDAVLRRHDPATTDPVEFRGARFDAGLAWVNFPEGHGGLGIQREWQPFVDDLFRSAGAPEDAAQTNAIGLGMAAPTIISCGTEAQKRRFLRPLWTGEEVWCQLFSEPGAGSDLASLGTRAVRDGDEWVVNGQKVWTSNGQLARYAILIARTAPELPKHQGITYFLCDMTDPGVEVRPLRQITGEAEFNEVFLADVRIPDSNRLGAEGDGWRIANLTLNNERIAIGGRSFPREGGALGSVARSWRKHPEKRTPDCHDRLLRLYVETEVARCTGARLRQKMAAGQPGAEGALLKIVFARINQDLSGLELDLLAEDGLRYPDWNPREESGPADFFDREPGYRFLRMKGVSIEGGSSEILRNIIAERVLGLPAEPRTDKNIPWKDTPR